MNALTLSPFTFSTMGMFTLTDRDRAHNRKAKTMTTEVSAPNETTELLFAVSDDVVEQDEFQRLPEQVRNDVDSLLIAFREVFAARKQNPELKRQALNFGNRRGFAFQSLRQKYFKYKASGDWRVLVDNAKVSKSTVTDEEGSAHLPHDFIEFYKGLCQSNNRVSEAATRLLYRMWRLGESIPGYGTWQEWFQDTHPHYPLPEKCPPDYPVGWSRGNLRKYFPTDAELALAREGVNGAKAHLPSIITTRSPYRPLEYVMFDDWKPDFKIIVPGFSSPVDLNLLVAIDVATGLFLRFGVRPAITRDDNKRDHLKLVDMKCLVAGVISQFGVPRHYKMTLVVENATAAIKDGFAMALREASCNQIEVSRTMMVNGTAIFGGYKDKTFGNPRGKGLLESSFNLANNEAGFAPGQTGRRYDQGPAELEGRTNETKALLKNTTLSPHDRVRLRLPFLTIDQARIFLTDIFNQMNARIVHDLEGFEMLGEWRNERFAQWQPESKWLELPEIEQGLVQWQRRKESPVERWSRLVALVGGRDAFARIHPGAITRLFDEHKVVETAAGEISFRYDNGSYVYRLSDAKNALASLRDHQKFLAYFDAHDLSWIHLTDGKGVYIASLPRVKGVRRGDREAMKREMEASRERLHELQRRVSNRQPGVAEKHLADIQHNAEVLEDAAAVELAPAIDGAEGSAPGFAQQISKTSAAIEAERKRVAAEERAIGKQAAADILGGGETETETGEDILSEI